MKNILVVLALLLGACGGGETADPQPAAQPTPAANPVRIQLFGDSTVAQEAPYWQSQWPSKVVSNAIGGTTSTQLVNGTDGLNMPWPNSIDPAATIIVIGHGTNGGTSFYPATPLAQYKDNLKFMASNAHGAKVIFETPLPNTDPRRMDTIPAYTQAMRDVASELHLTVIDRDACWRANPNWTTMLYDGTHATPDARQWTVEHCVAPVIEPLLAVQ